MESVDLQMEDIFGDQDGDGDEDLFTNHASIPDLPPDEGFEASGGATGDNPNIENDAVLARLRDLSKGAEKRTVKRVQPKLDPARLTGERGIGTLPKVFKDVKFKGKGHEADDLRKVMRYLEHWTHRLFPKMPFDEVLERIEKLGTKKEVQTYIKRMRLDMPTHTEDNAGEETAEIPSDTSPDRNTESHCAMSFGEEEDEVLDEIMRQEEEHTRQSQITQATPSSSSNQSSSQTLSNVSTPSTSTPGGLTAEQLERIEANKRRAQERRLAKLGDRTPVGTPSHPHPLQVNTPLTYPATPSAEQPLFSLSSSNQSASPLPTGKGENSSLSQQSTNQGQVDSEQLTEDQLLESLDVEGTELPTAPQTGLTVPTVSCTTGNQGEGVKTLPPYIAPSEEQ